MLLLVNAVAVLGEELLGVVEVDLSAGLEVGAAVVVTAAVLGEELLEVDEVELSVSLRVVVD